MYSWIWSKLPGGLPGKLIGSLALAAAAFALLWLVAFPAVRPLMPWNDLESGSLTPDGGTNQQEGGDNGPAGEDASCTPGVDCRAPGFDEEDWQTATPPQDGENEEGDG